jgi:hypothetical protein
MKYSIEEHNGFSRVMVTNVSGLEVPVTHWTEESLEKLVEILNKGPHDRISAHEFEIMITSLCLEGLNSMGTESSLYLENYYFDFDNIEVYDVAFCNMRLVFSDCTFKNCTFEFVDFYKELIFEGCTFENCSFEECNFYLLGWHCDKGQSVKFEDCNIGILEGALELEKKNFVRSLPVKCPEEGSFIGFKKCYDEEENAYLVTLEIPAWAKRVSTFRNKCRASAALVLSIEPIDHGKEAEKVFSTYNHNFFYRVGDLVVPTMPFDEHFAKTCTSGIHFFLSREEAKDWGRY